MAALASTWEITSFSVVQCQWQMATGVQFLWRMVMHSPEKRDWCCYIFSFINFKKETAGESSYLDEAIPRHHNVRFAQHFLSLINAVLSNIKGCKHVLGEITRNGDRKDKKEASGYLNTWNKRQIWFTAPMGDIFEVFTSLEKQMQRGDLLLPDMFTCSSILFKFCFALDVGSGLGWKKNGSNERKTCLHPTTISVNLCPWL